MKWGWLVDNLGLKLFALLLAALLYVHVLTERTIEETVEFPLVVEDLHDSLAFAAPPPGRVVARLQGTGKQILRLRYLEPALEVSLAGVGPGTYQRMLGPADVPLEGAGGVTVLEIVEPRLVLEVEPRGERSLPVFAPVTGVPARGYVVAGDPVVRPAVVRVSGPASWLARQDSLFVEPVAIAGRRESLVVVQRLAPLPGFVRAAPGSLVVTVGIDVEETRTIRVPVEVRGIRPELRAEPRPAAVTVTWRGSREKAGGIEAGAYRARADAGRRGRGEWLLPLEVTGPGLRPAGGGALAVASADSVRVVLH
jgi:hypothetical protein